MAFPNALHKKGLSGWAKPLIEAIGDKFYDPEMMIGVFSKVRIR